MDNLDKMMQGIASNPETNLAHSLTHEQFVKGINNKTLEYTIIGERSDLLSGGFKRANNAFKLIYMLSPLILVPLFSFWIGNWWLLFGILFSYIGSLLGAWKSNIPAYLIVYFIGKAIFGHFSFKEYQVFYYCCMLWGYLWFQIAEQSQRDYASFELLDKPELYNLAVQKNRIIVSEMK